MPSPFAHERMGGLPASRAWLLIGYPVGIPGARQAPMAKQDRDYEIFVRDITQTLLKAEGLTTVKVEHDLKVAGIARPHQIDVYWEYQLGGVLHGVIINCKNYRTPVEAGDVETLAGVLHDLPGVRGLIVTTVGFQKGAIAYAKTYGIGLKVIRPPKDEDFEGRIREIHLDIVLNTPLLLELKTFLNAEWAKAQAGGGADMSGSITALADLTKVRDVDSGLVVDVNELWNRAIAENPTEPGTEASATLRWKNAFIECPGIQPRRIDSIVFSVARSQGRTDQNRHPKKTRKRSFVTRSTVPSFSWTPTGKSEAT